MKVVEDLRQRAIACNAITHLPAYADDRDPAGDLAPADGDPGFVRIIDEE